MCWLGGASGLLLALLLMRTAPGLAEPALTPTSAPALVLDKAVAVDSIATDVIQRDPFRLSRRPSQVPFIADTLVAAVSAEAKPAAPALLLAGIVGGPPWAAIIEGVPGREGPVVVYRGDTLAGLRVRDVRSDRAVVSSVDTTWVLTIKRTWQ